MNTPSEALLNTYFDNWPPDEIQQMYRDHGFKCMDYWKGELYRIFGSTIHFTDEFSEVTGLEYYSNKYTGESVRICDMDEGDKVALFREFTRQLGIYWEIFPYAYKNGVLKCPK